jgi:hypothetical protein
MIGPRHILPAGGLTPDEARGFRMACACLATWGWQLAAEPSVAGSAAQDDVRSRFRKHGRVVAAMAAALDRQIGQATTPQDIPVEAVILMASP